MAHRDESIVTIAKAGLAVDAGRRLKNLGNSKETHRKMKYF